MVSPWVCSTLGSQRRVPKIASNLCLSKSGQIADGRLSDPFPLTEGFLMRTPNPVDVRKMLNIVESFKTNNIEFVAIPVAGDKAELLAMMASNLAKFEAFVEIDEKLLKAANGLGVVESIQKTNKGRIVAFVESDNGYEMKPVDVEDPWPDLSSWKRVF